MGRVVIIGNGGIGSELSKLFVEKEKNVTVISQHPLRSNGIKYRPWSEIEKTFAKPYPEKIIVTTGLLYDDKHTPEKSCSQFDRSWFDKNISANLMPTIDTVQAIMKIIPRSHPFKLITLSARVASITDNHLGGWHSYRMSKAALHMFVKNVAIEWRLKYPHSGIYSYHPGTVDTHLSKPFQKNVPKEKLFSAKHAAELLAQQADRLTKEQSGFVFDWKGNQLPY